MTWISSFFRRAQWEPPMPHDTEFEQHVDRLISKSPVDRDYRDRRELDAMQARTQEFEDEVSILQRRQRGVTR